MVMEWFAHHRRQKILETPFPDSWQAVLDDNVPVYARLIEDEGSRLRDDLRIFIEERSWEGCGGLELSDEMKVTIAAQACLLTLNREHSYFANVSSILIYPTEYHARQRRLDEAGVVEESLSGRLGEAWSNGPVILSWEDVLQGGRRPDDGHNVVYHEFAHKLDATDDEMNGVPLLENDAQVEEWAEVMHAEYELLVKAAEHGHKTLLDHYGATNAAEFFAVATECFFEKPVPMMRTHPRMYHVLQSYYHQDPAVRFEEAESSQEAD